MTLVSSLLLGVTLLAWIACAWLNPWDHHVSLGDTFHIGVWGRGFDCRLVVFNDADYGPYRGSTFSVSGGGATSGPVLERELGFGDAAGIYYRYFRWTDATLWTLMVSLWYPTALFSIAPLIWLMLRLTRRQNSGKCPKCGYDLRASAGRCPECGEQTDTA